MDDDLVAGLPARDARADLPDDAGGVRAADVVAVLRVVAVAEDRHRLAERGPDVVEVHAGRHDADDDLEGRGLGDLDLLELEGVLRLALALLADDPGGHRLGQLAGLGVDTWTTCVRSTATGQNLARVRLEAGMRTARRTPAGPTARRGRAVAAHIGPRRAIDSSMPPTPNPRRRHGVAIWRTRKPKFWPKKPAEEGQRQEDRGDDRQPRRQLVHAQAAQADPDLERRR